MHPLIYNMKRNLGYKYRIPLDIQCTIHNTIAILFSNLHRINEKEIETVMDTPQKKIFKMTCMNCGKAFVLKRLNNRWIIYGEYGYDMDHTECENWGNLFIRKREGR